MQTGTVFMATDRLGRVYKYRLEDIQPQDVSREFRLQNLTTDTETEVEAEWFRQRKIDIIAK